MPTPSPTERRGMTYAEAKAFLASHGVHRTIRTLERWVAQGILSIKRVTSATVFLFRDEVEALVTPEEPKEQRLLSAKLRHKGAK